jgi:hypothetical protein
LLIGGGICPLLNQIAREAASFQSVKDGRDAIRLFGMPGTGDVLLQARVCKQSSLEHET